MSRKGWLVAWFGFGLILAATTVLAAVELAKVNGRSITDKDLESALSGFNEGQRAGILKDKNSRTQILNSLVDQELLVQEAEKSKLENSPEYKEAMAQYHRQLMSNLLVKSKLANKLTEAEAKKYYDKNKHLFSTAQVRAQHILLETEKEALRVLKLTQAPDADFQALAEKHSKDPSAKNNRGELGYFGRDRMVAEFTEAAFTAKVGTVVGPVRTAFGYHLIKVIERDPGKTLGYDEVELKVKSALQQDVIRDYVTKLKVGAKISFSNK